MKIGVSHFGLSGFRRISSDGCFITWFGWVISFNPPEARDHGDGTGVNM